MSNPYRRNERKPEEHRTSVDVDWGKIYYQWRDRSGNTHLVRDVPPFRSPIKQKEKAPINKGGRMKDRASIPYATMLIIAGLYVLMFISTFRSMP